MPIKLNDAQLALLSAASQREDRYLTPPNGAKLAQARKAAAKLIEAGFVREVKAKGDAPVWRRDEEAHGDYALKLTAAGLKAIAASAAGDGRLGAKPASSGDALETAIVTDAEPELATNHTSGSDNLPAAASSAVSPRAGTKIAAIIVLLGRVEGATIDELVEATGWLPHTTRAALTGLRKRGYALTADRSDRTHGSIYRIAAAPPPGPSTDKASVEGGTVANGEKRANPAAVPRARRRAATPDAVVAGPYEAP